MSEMIYVASPYSHSDPAVQLARYEAVLNFTARQQAADPANVYFSPIVYSHHLDQRVTLSHETWMQLDRWFLERCDRVWVYMLDGWRESRGVMREIDIANEIDKRVSFCCAAEELTLRIDELREFIVWYCGNSDPAVLDDGKKEE